MHGKRNLRGRRTLLALLLLTLFVAAFTATALAHGAVLTYKLGPAIEIAAAFDSGEPMAGAQVTVFAPDDPATPWLTGVTDSAGHFLFMPDPAQAGDWDVQVRQAGHGEIIRIPVGESAVAGGTSGFTTMQLLLMGACVIWGLIGTALYFSGRKA